VSQSLYEVGGKTFSVKSPIVSNVIRWCTNDVSGRRVFTHEVVSRCTCSVAIDEGATDSGATLPDNLGEMTGSVLLVRIDERGLYRVLTGPIIILRSFIIPEFYTACDSTAPSFQVLTVWAYVRLSSFGGYLQCVETRRKLHETGHMKLMCHPR
jgi:hypothetical protein